MNLQELRRQDREGVQNGGRAVVIRYPVFEPDKRPNAMTMLDASPTLSRDLPTATDEMERYLLEFSAKYKTPERDLVRWLAESLVWGNHLEQVRSGLRTQLTRYEKASIEAAVS